MNFLYLSCELKLAFTSNFFKNSQLTFSLIRTFLEVNKKHSHKPKKKIQTKSICFFSLEGTKGVFQKG